MPPKSKKGKNTNRPTPCLHRSSRTPRAPRRADEDSIPPAPAHDTNVTHSESEDNSVEEEMRGPVIEDMPVTSDSHNSDVVDLISSCTSPTSSNSNLNLVDICSSEDDPGAALIQQLRLINPAVHLTSASQASTPLSDTGQDNESNGNSASSIYFVAIVTGLHSARVFCIPGPVVLPPSHRIGGILDFVVALNGPAGRTIERLPHNTYRVGTSAVPEDVADDFMSYRNNFSELSRLEEILAGPADSRRVVPARTSEPCTAILANLDLNDTVPLYVVYIYPEVDDESIATTGFTAPADPQTLIESYLALHYSSRRDHLAALIHMPGYQAAYKHCLIERQIMSVCNSLGIVFSTRQIVAAEVEYLGTSISIKPDDIASWMGVSPGTFAASRTDMAAASLAHRILRQLDQQVNAGRTVSPPMEEADRSFLRTLNTMLSSRILTPIDPHSGYTGVADLQAGDTNAVRMKLNKWRELVAEVKSRWGSQFQ
ncbi:hypothetical protein C8J57DRAFT_1539120 [Mycena rebaudengoi]|nr:hypothetical protein C8J57DRAFT_1539120 [Mycena rebaudengoi]